MTHQDLLRQCLNILKTGNTSWGNIDCSHLNSREGLLQIFQYLKNQSVLRANDRDKDNNISTNEGNEFFRIPIRDELSVVIPITVIYCVIFVTGILGNVCTCIVIWKNKFMHTATNYYLFNLAVTDLILLLFGLPTELYTVWYLYPWIFGETFCVLRTFFAEASTYTSILTITAFTVERYVAICHPMKAQKMSSLPRAIRVIFSTWVLGALSSIPMTVQFGIVYSKNESNRTVYESAMCANTKNIDETMLASSLIFFLFPMTFISILYTLIALAIRKSTMRRSSADSANREHVRGIDNHVKQQSRARKSVIKMLVAVVAGFFICWAPFHVERILTSNIEVFTPFLWGVYRKVYYFAGICYFCSCTINPVLYSIMSLKFRQAFKQTFSKSCCRKIQRQNRMTRFSYKFVHRNGQTETSYTTVGTSKRKSIQKMAKIKAADDLKYQQAKKPSPSPSISGSSLKSTDEICQDEGMEKVLFQIKCYDSNRNTAQLVVGVC